MAIFTPKAGIIKRSAGHSATAAAAYRSGTKIVDETSGVVHDYSKKGGVHSSFILAPSDAPRQLFDRSFLWNTVERGEGQWNSQVAREWLLPLPKELTKDQCIELTELHVLETFVSKGMVADVAFHDLDSHNPHAHILLTMRRLDSSGPDGYFSAKKQREWNKVNELKLWRERWAVDVNAALANGGHEARVDHRSYEAQGIDKVPQRHMGKSASALERRGVRTEVGNYNREVIKLNNELGEINNAIKKGEALVEGVVVIKDYILGKIDSLLNSLSKYAPEASNSAVNEKPASKSGVENPPDRRLSDGAVIYPEMGNS